MVSFISPQASHTRLSWQTQLRGGVREVETKGNFFTCLMNRRKKNERKEKFFTMKFFHAHTHTTRRVFHNKNSISSNFLFFPSSIIIEGFSFMHCRWLCLKWISGAVGSILINFTLVCANSLSIFINILKAESTKPSTAVQFPSIGVFFSASIMHLFFFIFQLKVTLNCVWPFFPLTHSHFSLTPSFYDFFFSMRPRRFETEGAIYWTEEKTTCKRLFILESSFPFPPPPMLFTRFTC